MSVSKLKSHTYKLSLPATRRVLDKNIRLRIQKRPPFLPNKI